MKKQFLNLGTILVWVLPFFVQAQTTYTFSNCSSTGSVGPTQAQVNAAYLGSNLQNSVTIVTQGIQQFTIPATGGYRIQADGAMGGGTKIGRAHV